METTIKDGKIECNLHGSLTAIDCDSLQGSTCEGCFIYTALKNQPTNLEDFSFKESSESSKTIN